MTEMSNYDNMEQILNCYTNNFRIVFPMETDMECKFDS